MHTYQIIYFARKYSIIGNWQEKGQEPVWMCAQMNCKRKKPKVRWEWIRWNYGWRCCCWFNWKCFFLSFLSVAAWRKNWMACQLPIIRLEVITFSHYSLVRFMVGNWIVCVLCWFGGNRNEKWQRLTSASETTRAIIALKFFFWLIATNSANHRKSPRKILLYRMQLNRRRCCHCRCYRRRLVRRTNGFLSSTQNEAIVLSHLHSCTFYLLLKACETFNCKRECSMKRIFESKKKKKANERETEKNMAHEKWFVLLERRNSTAAFCF